MSKIERFLFLVKVATTERNQWTTYMVEAFWIQDMTKAGNADMRYMRNFMEGSYKKRKMSILLVGKMVQMTEKESFRNGILI